MATPASVPQALGYVGVRAKDLGDWASYGSGLLGLQRIDKSRSSLAFLVEEGAWMMVASTIVPAWILIPLASR